MGEYAGSYLSLKAGEIYWHGYQGQQVIAVHEFNRGQRLIDIDQIKTIADGEGIQTRVMYGSVPTLGGLLLLASNDAPLDIYPKRRKDDRDLQIRIQDGRIKLSRAYRRPCYEPVHSDSD